MTMLYGNRARHSKAIRRECADIVRCMYNGVDSDELLAMLMDLDDDLIKRTWRADGIGGDYLSHAYQSRNFNILKYLVVNKCVRPYQVCRVLFQAIGLCDKDTVKYLLDQGADVNFNRLKHGANAWNSIYEDDVEMYIILHMHGLDIKNKRAMCRFVQEGYVNICEYILRHEPSMANIGEMRYGRNLLMIASKGGNIPMCELLLEHGADVNHIRKLGGHYHSFKTDVLGLVINSVRQGTYIWKIGLGSVLKTINILFDYGADTGRYIDGINIIYGPFNEYQIHHWRHAVSMNPIYRQVNCLIRRRHYSKILHEMRNEPDSYIFTLPVEIIGLIVDRI